MYFSCDDSGGKKGEPIVIMDLSELRSEKRDIDIVFVIDTSLSMADEQLILQGNFPNLVRVLKDISGGLPNLHIGTISPDLGTSPYNIPGCERPGGDQGRFMKGPNNSCTNPVNQTFVVDVEPRGCTIQKNIVPGQTTSCGAHDCTQANCEEAAFTGLDGIATEPAGLTFAVDENGCPRCRNYTGQTLEEVFSCMATLGTNGCGMEQQLEAINQAVTDTSGNNSGFLRYSAYLAIFVISDEDDCSAKQAELFNPQGDINSTLGTLTSFRCTEFGVVCDQPWERVMPQGQLTYSNCAPREADDPKNMLYPISRYTDTLSQLKDSSMIIVGAITGPYTNQVTVGLHNQNPKLQPSCGSLSEGADPAVRLKAFVTSFISEEEDMQWAFTSICASDFSPALVGLGEKLRVSVAAECPPFPIMGCPDPAAANGESPLTELGSMAEICDPMCEVQDIDSQGNITNIPLCDIQYQGGHPAERDPNLPVPVCYHVGYRPDCAIPCPAGSSELGCHPTNNPWFASSRGANIVISRRNPREMLIWTRISCQAGKLVEDECIDGKDDDEDGLIDYMDPDCANN